jgi:uncharacterized protein DUF5063
VNAVDDFAQAATRFCSVIELAGALELRRWLIDIEAALARVYASAAALPDVGPATDRTHAGMSSEEWSSLYQHLRAQLGEADRYWVIFDAHHSESLASASLADDLADIYSELRRGIEASLSGAPPEDVIFDWRESFESHWSRHALGALGAIRQALQEMAPPDLP